MMRIERIGDCTLYNGDCLEVMAGLEPVNHVISDPPYEAVMQKKWGTMSRNAPSSHVRHEAIGFDAIDDVRGDVARAVRQVCRGWGIFFCMAEGVRAWRDEIEATGAKYKRAMVWIKPDAMPQFNGQGPSVGHEMMVSAWYGEGYSKWNGGGKPGNFHHNKNTPGGSKHPTQKPLPLMLELVSLFTDSGETILDPFMGSGTTGVACAKMGRRFIGVELDERYFDVACERITKAYAQGDMFADRPKKVKPVDMFANDNAPSASWCRMSAASQLADDADVCHVCGFTGCGIGLGFTTPRDKDPRWLCAECALIVEDIKKIKRLDAFELKAREGGVEAAASVIEAYGTELADYTDEQAAILAGVIWKGCAARLRELVRNNDAPF